MAKKKVSKALAEQKSLGIHMLYPDVCTFPVNLIRGVYGQLGNSLDGRWQAKDIR